VGKQENWHNSLFESGREMLVSAPLPKESWCWCCCCGRGMVSVTLLPSAPDGSHDPTGILNGMNALWWLETVTNKNKEQPFPAKRCWRDWFTSQLIISHGLGDAKLYGKLLGEDTYENNIIKTGIKNVRPSMLLWHRAGGLFMVSLGINYTILYTRQHQD